MPYKVIQWATGNVGLHALRGIVEHPELELVGLLVHSPQKAGKDAGELAGLEPVGVQATNNVDEILALEADAVSYMATGDLRPTEAVDDMVRVLESGKNIVSTSVVPLIYPPAA
ncbi:MAG: dihydrodipicolinate reductase, partial [Acidimicrobiia bacterium]|nr:dihydrodipicolinate reductase [Acidimicrobiia bacterium]